MDFPCETCGEPTCETTCYNYRKWVDAQLLAEWHRKVSEDISRLGKDPANTQEDP